MHASFPPPEDDGWFEGPADPGSPDLHLIDAILPAGPPRTRRSVPAALAPGAARAVLADHPGIARMALLTLGVAAAGVLLVVAIEALPPIAWLACAPPAVLLACAIAWFRRRGRLASDGSGADTDEH